MRLLDRTPTDPPPALPLFSGVYNFPWYNTSLNAWGRLLVIGAFFGFIFRFLLEHMPR
jgi:hypothetical protein